MIPFPSNTVVKYDIYQWLCSPIAPSYDRWHWREDRKYPFLICRSTKFEASKSGHISETPSSTTPSERQGDTLLRGISWRSHENKSCLLWPLDYFRNPVRNLLSSTTPSGRQEDTPLLDLFRGISERRQENKSCLLWPLDNFRNPARNLLSSTTPASRHKDTYSLYLFRVCLSQVFLFSEISIFCLWQIWKF